jgi:cytoskeletal protein RodZ
VDKSRVAAGPHAPAEVDAATLLAEARIAHGLTIDDLARTTKIGRSTLAALESRDTTHLPAAIYTRGFVKSYAREVGLDPDATAALYLAQLEPAMPPSHRDPGGPTPATREEVMRLDDDTATILATTQARRVGALVTAACAVGLVFYVWNFNRQAPMPAPALEAPTADVDAAPAAGAAGSGPDAVAASPAESAALSGPLHIELKPAGLCWVAVTADGEQVLARLLRQGDQETITANDVVTIRVGDPGALTYSINGKAGRPLGRAGQPVSVRITRDNLREFIAS